jgi:hypothetical protein
MRPNADENGAPRQELAHDLSVSTRSEVGFGKAGPNRISNIPKLPKIIYVSKDAPGRVSPVHE